MTNVNPSANASRSIIVNLIDSLVARGWETNKIHYYFNLNPVLLKNLISGSLKSYKLENLKRFFDLLKNDGDEETIKLSIQILFDVQI